MDKIKKYGEEVLRSNSEEVKKIDGTILDIIKKMKKVLKEEKGLGLAAPQIGISKRIFIALDSEKKRIFTVINPEIIKKKGKEIDFEGCLSFPEMFFSIERAKTVVVKGQNDKGEDIIIEANGILARCFQHEIDHLNGKLIIDYATKEEKKVCKEKIERLLKK
ncbi:peptide deformylase [bacterium]|nr:peptide deformylase [bacterium]